MTADEEREGPGSWTDGTTLDVVIVEAVAVAGGCTIEAAIATGDHKGDLVTVTFPGLDIDPIELLGLAATITIVDGRPRLTL